MLFPSISKELVIKAFISKYSLAVILNSNFDYIAIFMFRTLECLLEELLKSWIFLQPSETQKYVLQDLNTKVGRINEKIVTNWHLKSYASLRVVTLVSQLIPPPKA